MEAKNGIPLSGSSCFIKKLPLSFLRHYSTKKLDRAAIATVYKNNIDADRHKKFKWPPSALFRQPDGHASEP
ncbi:hypothetical protein [Paenibacillus sp. URB8-2]|uniref:hypothetical protein n=1 Tax=Paenibacillus sp. URB8-2 TaxID=2741301 RepID=UPI0015B94178|nr:hypothetical protein [Paenibacillus sp. URB8-2]